MEIAAIIIAILSLGWGVWWSTWAYRRLHMPRIQVHVKPSMMMIKAGKATFTPQGGGKPSVIENDIFQSCVSVIVHNVGPSPITINEIQVRLAKSHERIVLQGCWLAVQDDEKVPRVIRSNEIWEGRCDYSWLTHQLENNHGKHETWNLLFSATDIAGVKYEKEISFPAKYYLEMIKQIKLQASPESGLTKHPSRQRA